ncbi:TonB-dependent receptor [Enterobacteriaceae bacterium BIT-l23]|uniref:TonB-dependent receptor plug domain-containing protein n=1 Tax=Jejubacter sp. L23 TaxID=3092086 RepID=UPI0015845FED|nr:TonB-dependent receptor [Enterobacteriaceae bacterium BIT-l23]
MEFSRSCLYSALSLVCASDVLATETMTVWSSPAAATSTILDRQTLTALDKENVAQALSVVPGVILQKSGGRNELQVKVRGFDSRQVPIFFDGVPIYVPYDGNLDLGRLLTADIASIEVGKGYSSLLQGPGQMGGAINITTGRPTKPLEVNAGYRQGWVRGKDSGSERWASLGVSHDAGYFQLSGTQRKQRFLGLPHRVDNPVAGRGGRMANSAADDKRGILKLGVTPGSRDDYSITYIRQDGSKDNPPYAGSHDQRSRYWQWPQYDKESYYFQGITALGETLTLKSRLYRDTFKNTLLMYNSLADLKRKSGSYSHYSDYSHGAGLQLASDVWFGDLLAFAVNWKDDVHREKGARAAPYDRYRDRTWSLASEYQWSSGDRVEVVAGISYDWRNSLEGKKHEKNGTLTHYAGNRVSAFNWQVMTKYHVDNKNSLAFSVSDRTRFPTLKERYTTSRPAYNQIARVNPGLKPERASGVDLTWNGAFSHDGRYEASLYYNRVDDAIESQSIEGGLVQNQNIGRVDYVGMDIGVRGHLVPMLEVGLSYGLVHAQVKRRNTGNITGLPTHTATVWFTLAPLSSLSLTISEEARSASDSVSSGTQKAAGFAVTHLRADYEMGKGLSLNVSISNLFDTRYAYSEGFTEEGRRYQAGVTYRF